MLTKTNPMKKAASALLTLVLALTCLGALPVGAETENRAPDYAQEENWAYYAIGADADADLFLICPTVDVNDEYNMSLDDEDTKASFVGALNMERGIYEESARM